MDEEEDDGLNDDDDDMQAVVADDGLKEELRKRNSYVTRCGAASSSSNCAAAGWWSAWRDARCADAGDSFAMAVRLQGIGQRGGMRVARMRGSAGSQGLNCRAVDSLYWLGRLTPWLFLLCRLIVRAAQLISEKIDRSGGFEAGFQWCCDELREAGFIKLANEVGNLAGSVHGVLPCIHTAPYRTRSLRMSRAPTPYTPLTGLNLAAKQGVLGYS